MFTFDEVRDAIVVTTHEHGAQVTDTRLVRDLYALWNMCGNYWRQAAQEMVEQSTTADPFTALDIAEGIARRVDVDLIDRARAV